MTTRQKKRTGAVSGMEEGKKKRILLLILPEFLAIILICAGTFLIGLWNLSEIRLQKEVSCIVLSALGILGAGFCLRNRLFDDFTGEEQIYFWGCTYAGIILAFSCIFLPDSVWIFLPLYVALTLFGGPVAAIVMGTTLVAVPVLLKQEVLPVFFQYFFSGMTGCVLFQNLKKGFHAGIPILLALSAQLVCQQAVWICFTERQPGLEDYLLCGTNVVICAVLLLGILNIFSEKVIYKYRLVYLDLNNPESRLLQELKQADKRSYLKCVHTAYFCERIALKLGMDDESLKCAGYYHSLDQLKELLEQNFFPPDCGKILQDFCENRKSIQYRETAVLLASQKMISGIYCMLDENFGEMLDYQKVIDEVFAGLEKNHTLDQCSLTMKEYTAMKKIFEEEKLYYDFLR